MLLLRAGAAAGCEELPGPGPWADPTAANGAASGSPAAHGLLLRQSVVLDALGFTKEAVFTVLLCAPYSRERRRAAPLLSCTM